MLQCSVAATVHAAVMAGRLEALPPLPFWSGLDKRLNGSTTQRQPPDAETLMHTHSRDKS